MKKNLVRLVAVVAIALVVVGVVGVAAYHFGVTSTSGAPMMRGMPVRGFVGVRGYDWPGVGLLGLLGLVLVGVLVFWLLAALLSPNRGGSSSTGPAAGDVERLRELSDMHAQGHLTDDEFAAAKRKILGL
jgi:uncharacterized membrane protein